MPGRSTLCVAHDNERYKDAWRKCREFREGFETKKQARDATNEYNFVKLENMPHYKPTKFAKCK